LILPLDWKASTALPLKSNDDSDATIDYAATTLQTFVDSPIMCGRYQKIYQLNDASQEDRIVPHHLHIFSEVESAIELNGEVLDRLKKMVTQTARLMGSSPFDRFEILLALSNQLPVNGLEHARSTLNVLTIDSVASPASLKGWSRLLIPHEYLHAWCGKYRRPDAMVTSDFHAAEGTDLLWVYEGLTQYLGELVEARCGLMTHDQFRDRIGVELRNASLQQSRQWRPLIDTAAASHILRDGSDAWPKLRGGQDYYMEGMLFWLEADAVLRTKTEGRKSIDDFCQRFFQADGTQATALGNRPKPFSRADVIQELTVLCDHDWDGMIRRRIESPQQTFDMQIAELLGYRMTLSQVRPSISESTFRLPAGADHYDSIGAIFSPDGTVRDILLESPADRAKLVPGTKVLGINGRTFNPSRLNQAIIDSARSSAIELIVSDGDFIRTVELQYHDGLKYLTLVRDEAKPDLLETIVAPR
jgi:predicted metalloprotease with PDZ domain